MMQCTDRHDRYLLRLISRHVMLYTEMVTSGALVFGDTRRFLEFNPREHPIALQIGGSDPAQMARCGTLAEDAGYDEININVGCPSTRVQAGRFGACLMIEPERVAACYKAMVDSAGIPVTIKTRIGVDDHDSYTDLCRFVEVLAGAGCSTFIVHARKAWLHGVSPKQNRELPPLRYEIVYRLKRDYRELEVIINGGVTNLDAAQDHLNFTDGVMIGRAVYQNPFLIAEVDSKFFADDHSIPSRTDVLAHYLEYVDNELTKGVPLQRLARHLFGLFTGLPGAKAWRRHLAENMHRLDAGTDVVAAAATYAAPDFKS